MSLFCCVIFIWLHAVNVCKSQLCQSGLPCKWTVDNHELDLTAFQMIGLTLTGHDNEYIYDFTPCNNLLTVGGFYRMVQQRKIKHPLDINYLAKYDANIMPSIQLDSNSEIISWYFDYSQNFSVQYFCDYSKNVTSYMEITQILEIVPYKYLIQIASLYACENITAPYNLSYNQCIWYDAATSSTLDLRPLYGQVISKSDSYVYTVCQDSFYSSYSTDRCGMWGTTKPSSNYLYSIWDPSVMPIYSMNNGSWTFSYQPRPNNIIQWVCDRWVNTYKVMDWSTNDHSRLVIASQYACTAPVDCVFIDPDNNEHVLDLTDLKGQLLQIINNDFTYSYQYSPCSNVLSCNDDDDDDVSVMAMRWNIYERECDPYLAIYDGFNGYKLFYNESNVEWQFTYNNGELCPDDEYLNVEFNIYWKCNRTVTDAFVTNAKTINSCLYSMYIESLYACF